MIEKADRVLGFHRFFATDPKVADFGLSQKESLLKTSKAVYGTPYWMAPVRGPNNL
jgi:hypothetical protein